MKHVIRSEDDFLNILPALRQHLTGKPIQVTIKPFKRDRSLDQNKKLHAMIRELALHCGYPERQMKEILKAQFAPINTVTIGGRICDVPRNTSDMSIDEMSQFMDDIEQLGAELGVTFDE